MKNKVVEIVITSHGGVSFPAFTAEVKGDEQLWASGDTEIEALGNLINQRQKELNFKITT